MELHTPKYVKVLQYVVMIIMALFMYTADQLHRCLSAGSYELQGAWCCIRHHLGDHDGAVRGTGHSAVPPVPQLRYVGLLLAADPPELLRSAVQRLPFPAVLRFDT